MFRNTVQFQSSPCLVFGPVLHKNVTFDQAGKLLAKGNATKAGPVGIKQQDFSALVVLPLPERLLQYFPPNYPVGATNYPTHGFNYEQCRDTEALVRGIIARTDGCCRLLLHQ